MRRKNDTSPGGSSILHHEARERPWTAPEELAGAEEIEEHFRRHFGAADTVLHELVSDLVHLDVHVIAPTAENDFWTLFTTGMSDLPMTVPEGAEECRFAELVLLLPPEWKIGSLKTPPPADLERWYWPIRWLKKLARFPHEYETWLGQGHSIPNGEPPAAFSAETKLCAWWLLPPVHVPPEAGVVNLRDGREVNIYCLHALHLDELSLKLNRGSDTLIDEFDRAGMSAVLAPERPSCVKRKLFGLL